MENFLNLVPKKILLGIFAVFLLSGCVTFDADFDSVVEQPAVANAGDTIPIIAHVKLHDNLPVTAKGKIGILLPLTWSINTNTVYYNSAFYNGSAVFSPIVSSDLMLKYPPSPGYFWWGAETSDISGHETAVTVTFDIIISDSASDNYELDYRVGSSKDDWESEFLDVPINVVVPAPKPTPSPSVIPESDSILEEDDNNSVSSATKKKYNVYKEKYKNEKSRSPYKEVKKWKKGTAEEVVKYQEIKGIYKKYKHLSKRERKMILTSEEYAKYQEYKRYKGYKEYKKLRDKVK